MRQWMKWLVPTTAVGLGLIGCGLAGITTALDLRMGQAEAVSPAYSKPVGYSWPQWNTPGTKFVPILTVGTPNVSLGMAQVTGPKAQVSRVRAVLQVNADFNGIRGKVLVPSDSLTDLRRVHGTAVTGLAQYKLIDFADQRNKDDQRARSKYPTQPQRDRYYPPQGRKPACTTAQPAPKLDYTRKYHQDNGKHKGWYKEKKRAQSKHHRHD